MPLNSSPILPSLEELLINGKPQFGIFKKVNTINYLDYPSHRLSQKSLKNWQKWLACNQFCFVRINQPPYQFCVAIASIKLATTCFCYIFDETTQQIIIDEQLMPLTFGCELNQSPYSGAMRFKNRKSNVMMNFLEDTFEISINNPILKIQATAQRHAQPLAVCSPTGRYGWVFTQKEITHQLDGDWKLKPKTKINTSNSATSTNVVTQTSFQHFSSQSLLSIDWTLGYMRRETTWFWVSIHDYLADGRQFSLNLATGVNESGTSENACWIDGEIFYLPPVMFERDRKNTGQSWRIFHQNVGWSTVEIDITFTPKQCYRKNDRLIIIDSIFEQWVGYYSGEIKLAEHTIQIENLLGLAEDHFAKW